MSSLLDVQPSTGCTEPSAVALAAALAARAAGGSPWWITVACDAGTYRNGQLACLPGCGGRAGLDLAAALGAFGGDPDRALDVLGTAGPDALESASNFVMGGGVSVVCRGGPPGLSIYARVESDRSTGEAKLGGDHLHVVSLLKDGEPLPRPDWSAERPASAPRPDSLAQALALAEELDLDDQELLLEGFARNVGVAARSAPRAGLDAAGAAGALAEAASRARMSGERVTVTTSGWSGNQGLVATLPLFVVGRHASRAELARALATSHLVGHLLREGAPSPLCHALVAASAGAAAGCVQLRGGDAAAVERACNLVIASAGAPACDGAKPACALRVGLAAAQAVRCAERALEGPTPIEGGLVGQTLEETARRLGLAAARLAANEASCGA